MKWEKLLICYNDKRFEYQTFYSTKEVSERRRHSSSTKSMSGPKCFFDISIGGKEGANLAQMFMF